jgi:hypothetical protein
MECSGRCRDEVRSWVNQRLKAPTPPDPLTWIESHVDLGDDPSSAMGGLIRLEPYQREPMAAQFDAQVRRVVVCAPEQTGKSVCWRLPMLYRVLWSPAPAWICYESDDKAEDINAEQFDPLLRAQPAILEMMNRTTARRRRYEFPNGAVIDFGGAGAAITSKPRCWAVADELDTWPMLHDGILANLRNLEKRLRTYAALGRGCLVVVSSPKGSDSPIWEQWQATSQGRFHLRCRGCGKPTMRSDRVGAMQWDCGEDGQPIPESIRLICPACHQEHTEADAAQMAADGAYVHEYPANVRHRGFQWGALACPRVFPWADIAAAQMAAGKTAGPAAQVYLDNSIRGVPWVARQVSTVDREAGKLRRELPPADMIAAVLWAADTQDQYWRWVVRAVDTRENTYLLATGVARTPEALLESWDAEYRGMHCEAGIIDEGGHRGKDVLRLLDLRPGLHAYKGSSNLGSRWRSMREDARRLLASPYVFQAELLFRLHRQREATDEAGGWYFAIDPPTDYLDELYALRPNNSRKNGHHYEHWTAEQRPDHSFDAEKMWMVLLDYAQQQFTAKNWRATKEAREWEQVRPTRVSRRRRCAVPLSL